MIGVSACLMGTVCTYKGGHNYVKEIKQLKPYLIPICPEVMGGLSIPRPPAEIISKDPLTVVNNIGIDVTYEYMTGSNKALELLLENNVKVALLKRNSPSCGCDGIYDGTFSHQLIEGQGTFAALCTKHDIKVFHEQQLDEFFLYLKDKNIYKE